MQVAGDEPEQVLEAAGVKGRDRAIGRLGQCLTSDTLDLGRSRYRAGRERIELKARLDHARSHLDGKRLRGQGQFQRLREQRVLEVQRRTAVPAVVLQLPGAYAQAPDQFAGLGRLLRLELLLDGEELCVERDRPSAGRFSNRPGLPQGQVTGQNRIGLCAAAGCDCSVLLSWLPRGERRYPGLQLRVVQVGARPFQIPWDRNKCSVLRVADLRRCLRFQPGHAQPDVIAFHLEVEVHARKATQIVCGLDEVLVALKLESPRVDFLVLLEDVVEQLGEQVGFVHRQSAGGGRGGGTGRVHKGAHGLSPLPSDRSCGRTCCHQGSLQGAGFLGSYGSNPLTA